MKPILARASLEYPALLLPVAFLLIAAAAALIWTNTVSRNRPQGLSLAQVTGTNKIDIVVGARDIPAGQIVRAGDLAIKELSPGDVPAGSLRRLSEIEGHLSLASIHGGSPVLKDMISAQLASGIAPLVPQGYRAYAIPVSEADIAGGFLEANDAVDLYVTLPSVLFPDPSRQGRGDRSKAMLLLQDVRVLAVGSKLKPGHQADPSVRTVTLALSTADLAKVALAARLGRISFAIRNPADNQIAANQLVQVSTLLGEEKPQSRRHQQVAGIPYLAGRSRSVLRIP